MLQLKSFNLSSWELAMENVTEKWENQNDYYKPDRI